MGKYTNAMRTGEPVVVDANAAPVSVSAASHYAWQQRFKRRQRHAGAQARAKSGDDQNPEGCLEHLQWQNRAVSCLALDSREWPIQKPNSRRYEFYSAETGCANFRRF